MRTTLDIDDSLLVEAKAVAARRRTSLTALIEKALRSELSGKSKLRASGTKVELPLLPGGKGMLPGVDPTWSLGKWEEWLDENP
ncbi:DUF6364 family protein [Hydrocarboniphaga sp.]|uniref:DUF6364 family protein n=1 Tax=Hydrocarboniphaga sp. TaxID=2033016 RepID=UPI003D0E2454